ncbi:MAG: polysaccharide deacetylase family protein [Planctomycetota bacterium]|jgi:hypothetical protein
MDRLRTFLAPGQVLAALCLLLALGAEAEEGSAPVTPVRRTVLALIDSEGQSWQTAKEDPVHQMIEMPLNHLGMVVRRHDIRKGPPPPSWLGDLRAVLTCFDHTESPVPWLWPWLEARAATRGVRFIHIRNFGPLQQHPGRLVRWLKRFGLGFDDYFTRAGVTVELRDPKLCAYETDPRRNATHQGPWNQSERNAPWVTTRCGAEQERARTPVVTGPWGGIALAPWIFNPGTGGGDRRWHLDPFAFFREVLALDGVPAPEPRVLNGRRMFFFHVDGDGFESISTVKNGKICGQVFLEDIVERYDLPVSVSVIVASLTDDIRVEKPTESMRIASRIFANPRVQVASHTVLHPFSWSGEHTGDRDPKYRGFSGIANYEPSLKREISESLSFINRRLCPPGRRCEILFWSGEAAPTEEVILEADRLGSWNLNGGTYRWDALHDSVGFVAPLGRVVGKAVQVYCGAPNENVYDGFYERMPTAFRHVGQTIERTGAPRILKPANIYIHFYSSERPARHRTLKKLIQRWGIEEPTAPVFASTYAAAVTSALTSARVLRTPTGWSFRDFDECRTARIDGETRSIDFARSRGVLGARRHLGSLFVHLAGPDADLVLAKAPPPLPHVVCADHELLDGKIDETGLVVTSLRRAKGEIVIAGFPPDSEVDLTLGGTKSRRKADADGRLAVTFPRSGSTRVEVRRR